MFTKPKTVSKFLLFRGGKDCKILSTMAKQNSKTKHNILIYTRGPLAARAQSVDSGRFVRTIGKGFHPKG